MAGLRWTCVIAALALAVSARPIAQEGAAYRFSFDEREHRLLHVEAIFRGVPAGPLQLRMSRTSPGRYGLHEFAKNVIDVRVADASGRALTVTRPNLHQWDVTGHAGEVRVTYRLFGDRVDGTFLAVDTTHAHINMPAAVMWARGFEQRPATVSFAPPPGSSWRVATQLLPGRDALTFTAPNLQYLMDSPAEVSAFAARTFTVPDAGRTPVFRVVAHHGGADADLDPLVRDVEAVVREAKYVFGEYPAFEGNTYSFIVDALPWAERDAMEHRNSTIITSSVPIRSGRRDLLDAVAHEFIHAWNVERIRPASLEPFSLEEASTPEELWFAEGFSNYYGPLVLARAGLITAAEFARGLGEAISVVTTSPGRHFRSPVEMSRMAAFVDPSTAADPTNFENTFTSYYSWGEVIAAALDLELRTRSDGRVSLDDFMRLLWTRHGKSGSANEIPYSLTDLKTALGQVSGDPAFAAEFFARYIEGRDLFEYAPLLARAGMTLRRSLPARPFIGSLPLQDSLRGARVAGAVPYGTPAYAAGLDRGDVILSIAGARISGAADVDRVLGSRRPGDSLPLVFERRGEPVSATLLLVEDPRVEIVLAEQSGTPLTDPQRRFRAAWLGSGARSGF